MAMFIQKYTTDNLSRRPIVDMDKAIFTDDLLDHIVRPEDVFSVECAGNELYKALRIIGRYDKLPSRIFTFYGYQAQMIAGNWSQCKQWSN